MQQQAPPAWLSDIEESGPLTGPGGSKQVLLTPGGLGSSDGTTASSIPGFCTPVLIQHTLRAMTMALCVLMFSTACVGAQTIDGVNKAGRIFIVVYMLFFSGLLFLFEVIQIRKVEWLDHMFQRNFGFLYSVVGKAFFVIFIAFLSFGLGDPETLSMATGLSLACFGAAIVALYLKYPELFENQRQTEMAVGSEIMSTSL